MLQEHGLLNFKWPIWRPRRCHWAEASTQTKALWGAGSLFVHAFFLLPASNISSLFIFMAFQIIDVS